MAVYLNTSLSFSFPSLSFALLFDYIKPSASSLGPCKAVLTWGECNELNILTLQIPSSLSRSSSIPTVREQFRQDGLAVRFCLGGW